MIRKRVLAKSKLVNCNTHPKIHGASIRIKLEPSLTPAAGCNLLKEVLLGTTHILRTPEPSVTIKDLSAEMIDFELSFSVADVGSVDQAQNELFDRDGRWQDFAAVKRITVPRRHFGTTH